MRVLQDLQGRVYRRGGLKFVETRWIYHEVHRVRFPAPHILGQKGRMWKVEEFHFAKGMNLAPTLSSVGVFMFTAYVTCLTCTEETRIECRPLTGVHKLDILDENGQVTGRANVTGSAASLNLYYGVM